MKPGTEVIWTHTQRGGYGWQIHTYGMVVDATPKTVLVAVATSRSVDTVRVNRKSVRPCHELFAQAFNNLMMMG